MLSIRLRRRRIDEEALFPSGGDRRAVGARRQFRREPRTYNPRSKPAQVAINKERLAHWLKRGAKPSDSVRTLLAKHLSRDLSAVAETPAAQ